MATFSQFNGNMSSSCLKLQEPGKLLKASGYFLHCQYKVWQLGGSHHSCKCQSTSSWVSESLSIKGVVWTQAFNWTGSITDGSATPYTIMESTHFRWTTLVLIAHHWPAITNALPPTVLVQHYRLSIRVIEALKDAATVCFRHTLPSAEDVPIITKAALLIGHGTVYWGEGVAASCRAARSMGLKMTVLRTLNLWKCRADVSTVYASTSVIFHLVQIFQLHEVKCQIYF